MFVDMGVDQPYSKYDICNGVYGASGEGGVHWEIHRVRDYTAWWARSPTA